MELFLAIVGTLITIISFIYAIIQGRQLAKLREHNRESSWELFRQSLNAIADIQKLDLIQPPNKDYTQIIGRVDVILQEIAMSSIRMIKRFEKRFDEEMIKEWTSKNKLENDSHVKAFRKFL